MIMYSLSHKRNIDRYKRDEMKREVDRSTLLNSEIYTSLLNYHQENINERGLDDTDHESIIIFAFIAGITSFNSFMYALLCCL